MIFKIEEFSVFDGPGIRTTIFFKGCPLRCSWCHNPEGLSFEKELMVSNNLCRHCGKCMAVCPDNGNCTVCGTCVKACPIQIRQIVGMEMPAVEIAKKVTKNRSIYEASGGGVTFSGGEPLAQPELLMDTIYLLDHIHKVVETSGYAKDDVFNEIIKKLDLVIMDIKIADSMTHRRYTGVDNGMILKNLEHLKSSGKPFWIRTPLIPGVTDTEDNMMEIAYLLKDAKNLERLELMPYNRSAGAKYPMVGRTYKPLFNQDMLPKVYLEPFNKYGIKGVVL